MLTEPNIDKNIIKSKIEENYDLHVPNLSFVQGGECSWGYKVETDSGINYFLKIHEDLDEYKVRFDLTYKLFTYCGIKNITHPINTQKGDLVFFLDKYPSALFSFISGTIAAERDLNEKQRFTLGELLGRIHKAKETIGEFVLKENFRYAYKDHLLQNIEKANFLKNHESAYIQKVAQLLINNKDTIIEKLHKLEILGNQLRMQNLDFVICHGEPHNWNIMTSDNEEVFLIDWDDCLFAPKEKDLRMIQDDTVAFEGYKHIVGKTTMNEEIVNFYDMKWNISEIGDWSSRIFSDKDNNTQNEHFLMEFISEIGNLNS